MERAADLLCSAFQNSSAADSLIHANACAATIFEPLRGRQETCPSDRVVINAQPLVCYGPNASATMSSSSSIKVLIVEDHDDSRTTLRMLLSMAHGHTVLEAADGHSALQIALDERPDAALIDVGLPGLDGYEVARRIREGTGPDAIFLIALTGYGSDEDRQKARDAGFDMHLVKPVDSAELARVLSTMAGAKLPGG
jgi:CheY-like chemotaxis protein